MLADKFWISSKGEILWVVEDFKKTILDNLEFFNLNESNASCKSAHKLGFVEGEVDNDLLILRSTNMKYLYETLNKIKEHIEDIKEIQFHLLIDNKIMVRNLNGKKEIQLFLDERIFPRTGKYKFLSEKQKKSFFTNIGHIINNLYAKKIKTNIISK
jgi:hypothetical protein